MSPLALAAGLCCAVCAAGQDGPKPAAVGDPVPELTLFGLDGQPVCLRNVKQPVIVLNFWAFWCDTWIAELPQLRELAAQQDALGFKLLAVSVDGVWTDQLRAVCGEQRLPFPVLVDRRRRASRLLRVRRIPTIVVIDGRREITYLHEGYPGNPEVLKAIREAASIAQPDAAAP
jgi:peroxiredoxin